MKEQPEALRLADLLCKVLEALRAAVADWDTEVSKGRWVDDARAAIERAHGIPMPGDPK